MIAVNRGRNRNVVPSGLHKLKHGGLAQYILKNDPVGTHMQIALTGNHLLIFGIVQVGEQNLVRKG